MARYFFNLRYGREKLAVDPVGEDVADGADLQELALDMAREMLRTPSHDVRDWMTCAFEVRNRDGRLVCVAPFAAMVADEFQF